MDRLIALGIGLMLQPGNGYLRMASRFSCWAADNGCFAKGDAFDLRVFYRWLDGVPRDRCLFAVAPDVYPDAAATLARSLPTFESIRELGFHPAYVLQPGEAPIPWDEFDALFIGGDDTWKLGPEPREHVLEARRRGKWVHMGRVNSKKRLDYAALIGCHSADGTFLRFRNRGGHDGVADLARWFHQPVLRFHG